MALNARVHQGVGRWSCGTRNTIMDKDKVRAAVDDLFYERDQRMDDLFNRLQQLTLDMAVLKGLITTLLEDKDDGSK